MKVDSLNCNQPKPIKNIENSEKNLNLLETTSTNEKMSQVNNNSANNNNSTEINSELKIIIIDENWSQYCYRIKINTPFGKLINRFCQQVRKADNKSVLFWYHGRLVEDDDTPKTLNIKDNDVILAHYIK